MHNSLYDYSPITERPRFEWPGGKKVAFYAGVAVEHYPVDKPSTSIFAGTVGLTRTPSTMGGETMECGWGSSG